MRQARTHRSTLVRLALILSIALAQVLVLPGAQAQTSPVAQSTPVTQVRVDASSAHQVIEGFGATTQPLVFGGQDNLTPDLRARAIDALYGQVKLSMGTTPSLQETDGPDPRRPANRDPTSIDWTRFSDVLARTAKQKVVDPGAPLGYNNFVLGNTLNTRWASPWLATLRTSSYETYLSESARWVVANQLYWRDQFGIVPKYYMLFNEPLQGNNELSGGSVQDLVDITRAAGVALTLAGFPQVKLVVPSEETELSSLTEAQAILSDPQARQYVGAISYHPYPYGSVYATVDSILSTSAAGRPDPEAIAARTQLRDLAAQYGVELWMTEVSSSADAMSYQSFLARSIHIHDEFTYADASAYFGMESMWDTTAQMEHFNGSRDLFSSEGNIVLIDDNANAVYITGMGRAIGHYARWLDRGATRVQSDSSDPTVQVSAFTEDGASKLVLVVINPQATDRVVQVSVVGGTLTGSGSGEQSTLDAYWRPLGEVQVDDPENAQLALPARSVTSLEFPFSASS
jgi:O-glycosyl hydrolase